MMFFTLLAAILATASAGQMYSNQPVDNYGSTAEMYQSALELQQRGLYSGQPQAHHSDAPHRTAHSADHAARILSFTSDNHGHGYQFSYETENGIKAQEVGHDEGKGLQAEGAYSYTGADGLEYTVTYTADERGFVPRGAHLPTPPPVPEAIARSLEQNARDEAAGIYDDGHYQSPEYSSGGYEQGAHHEQLAHAAPPAPPAPAAPAYSTHHHN